MSNTVIKNYLIDDSDKTKGDDEGDEDEGDEDEGDEDEGDEDGVNSSFTDNSDLFVISIDGIPKFYVKDEKTASEKMWYFTRILSFKHFSSGYRSNYVQISEKELHIIGSFRFFLLAYDQVIHRITYSKIVDCKLNITPLI